MNKKTLGQYYTTNASVILDGLTVPSHHNKIIEPFCGNGDLINWIGSGIQQIESYDIEPKTQYTVKRNTLLDPPDYRRSFIITNPPYLARNKSTDKVPFDKYNQNDLYKCFIKTILDPSNHCDGGILIVPLNFFCSIRLSDVDLRKQFLQSYQIIRMNLFDDGVFDDTEYTVCSFQFERRTTTSHHEIASSIPTNMGYDLYLHSDNDYTIGGEIYRLPSNPLYKIGRLIGTDPKSTNILVKCIDDVSFDYADSHGELDRTIGAILIMNDNDLYRDTTPKKSARSYLTITLTPEISLEQQRQLVLEFNQYLHTKRRQYKSLFLTNYRQDGRKRISFELIYTIVGNILVRI